MDKLKNIFATKGAAQKAEVKEFLKTYSDKVIDDVTISQTAGGMISSVCFMKPRY